MSGFERSARRHLNALAWLALVALATRGWTFGNPVLHVDDQFYLLGGQRLLVGDIPYLDFWDRKPAGLFLVYTLAFAFPDPVLGYQILAALAAAMTAWAVFAMAHRLVSFAAALAGATAYLAWLPLFGGIGGQAPVFYNLPVALAAALTMDLVAETDSRALTRRGCAIMLLAGLAMQIKYAAVFEGIFFGLSLMWLSWRARRSTARIAGDAALWIACALGPTGILFGAYAVSGHGQEFLQANFISILTDDVDLAGSVTRLFWQVLGLSPFWFCIWVALRHWRAAMPGPVRRQALWLIAWAGAAFGGYLAFGYWFDHYVLPLLPPLAAAAALAFGVLSRMRLAIGLVAGLGLAASQARAIVDMADRGNAREVDQLAALAARHKGSGCIYVTEDIPVLYVLTKSCLPSRFAFPEHLILKRYTDALGVDQTQALRELLAGRPDAIVFMTDPDSVYAPGPRGLLLGELERSYRPAGTVRTGVKEFTVFVRNGS